eukprot:scaffold10964_cov146-Skeletonema_marinoi.AAC.4
MYARCVQLFCIVQISCSILASRQLTKAISGGKLLSSALSIGHIMWSNSLKTQESDSQSINQCAFGLGLGRLHLHPRTRIDNSWLHHAGIPFDRHNQRTAIGAERNYIASEDRAKNPVERRMSQQSVFTNSVEIDVMNLPKAHSDTYGYGPRQQMAYIPTMR